MKPSVTARSTGATKSFPKAIAPYGLLPEDVPDTMDLFMNYTS